MVRAVCATTFEARSVVEFEVEHFILINIASLRAEGIDWLSH